MNFREKSAFNYNRKLMYKFRYNKEIRSINRSHVPKYILNAKRK